MEQLIASQHPALAARLEMLTKLQAGWMDGSGEALDREELAWFSDRLLSTWPTDLALPFICATPEGGVFLEWTAGCWIVSAEFPLRERQCALQAVHTKSNETIDEDCSVRSEVDFAAVYQFVRRFV